MLDVLWLAAGRRNGTVDSYLHTGSRPDGARVRISGLEGENDAQKEMGGWRRTVVAR